MVEGGITRWILGHTKVVTAGEVDMEEVVDIAAVAMAEAEEDMEATLEDITVHGLEDRVEVEIIIVVEISGKDFTNPTI